jgi:putative redox protein
MKTNFDSKPQLSGLTNALTSRRLEQTKDQPLRSVPNTDNGDSDAEPTSSHALFVIPRGRGDGFRASIRGHILDLADPGSGHVLAPTPDDLFIASIAAELAWSARRFLQAYGLPDDVSVSAEWRTPEDLPSLADISLTVTVSRRAEAVGGAALAAAFQTSLAARSLAEPVVHISFEGVNR